MAWPTVSVAIWLTVIIHNALLCQVGALIKNTVHDVGERVQILCVWSSSYVHAYAMCDGGHASTVCQWFVYTRWRLHYSTLNLLYGGFFCLRCQLHYVGTNTTYLKGFLVWFEVRLFIHSSLIDLSSLDTLRSSNEHV